MCLFVADSPAPHPPTFAWPPVAPNEDPGECNWRLRFCRLNKDWRLPGFKGIPVEISIFPNWDGISFAAAFHSMCSLCAIPKKRKLLSTQASGSV